VITTTAEDLVHGMIANPGVSRMGPPLGLNIKCRPITAHWGRDWGDRHQHDFNGYNGYVRIPAQPKED